MMLWYLGPRKSSSPSPTQVMQAICSKFNFGSCDKPLYTCSVRPALQRSFLWWVFRWSAKCLVKTRHARVSDKGGAASVLSQTCARCLERRASTVLLLSSAYVFTATARARIFKACACTLTHSCVSSMPLMLPVKSSLVMHSCCCLHELPCT